MKIKKFARSLLALVMVFSMMFMSLALAEEPVEVEDLDDPVDQIEEPIVVTELVDVEDLMINDDLDDEGWWNILLLGSDSRDFSRYYGLSDTIIILSVHPEDGQTKLTSIMRDTWLKIYGVGEQKINVANARGGPELIMRTVNEYFNMNINTYVLVSMQALVDIIDEIGGIEIDITKNEMKTINTQMGYDAADFKLKNNEELTEYGDGVHLNGNQALAYARIRRLDNDYVRTERQRTVLIAIASKLQALDLQTITAAASIMLNYVETNLSLTQILSLIQVGLVTDLSAVEQFRIPADGTFTSGKYDGLWSIRPDFEKNAELLHQFIYEGGIPEED